MVGLSRMTVIVPVRDDRRIVRCIESCAPECPVLVVFNGATPAFEAAVRAAAPRIATLSTPEPGIGRAYNLGLDACPTEYALLMDSDCVFLPGTIARIAAGLDGALLSKGRVEFAHAGPLSRVVARYRAYHTSDWVNAFSPPLGLSRTGVKLLLGRYFADELAWAEDYEFDLRVRAKNLRIAHDPEAVIVHPPLSPAADLRAAYRYGQGHARGAKSGLLPAFETDPLRRVRQHLRIVREVRAARGSATGLYALLWNAALHAGYRAEARRAAEAA